MNFNFTFSCFLLLIGLNGCSDEITLKGGQYDQKLSEYVTLQEVIDQQELTFKIELIADENTANEAVFMEYIGIIEMYQSDISGGDNGSYNYNTPQWYPHKINCNYKLSEGVNCHTYIDQSFIHLGNRETPKLSTVTAIQLLFTDENGTMEKIDDGFKVNTRTSGSTYFTLNYEWVNHEDQSFEILTYTNESGMQELLKEIFNTNKELSFRINHPKNNTKKVGN